MEDDNDDDSYDSDQDDNDNSILMLSTCTPVSRLVNHIVEAFT